MLGSSLSSLGEVDSSNVGVNVEVCIVVGNLEVGVDVEVDIEVETGFQSSVSCN